MYFHDYEKNLLNKLEKRMIKDDFKNLHKVRLKFNKYDNYSDLLKSYSFFENIISQVNDNVRYFLLLYLFQLHGALVNNISPENVNTSLNFSWVFLFLSLQGLLKLSTSSNSVVLN